MDPTISGFIVFIRTMMGITTSQLSDSSPYIAEAYNQALNLVNMELGTVGAPVPTVNSFYANAVYNLGADILVNITPDNQADPAKTFSTLRQQYKINSFISGMVQSSSDNGTSVSVVVADWAKNLTFLDLNTMKTPWGRTYLGMAQQAGPNVWGLS